MYPNKNIEVIENDPIVKKFYPNCITANRQNTGLDLTDNFIVTNCRSDHWNTLEGFTEHFKKYISYMKPGCRFFYSMRDTQLLGINRFKEVLLTTKKSKILLSLIAPAKSMLLTLFFQFYV